MKRIMIALSAAVLAASGCVAPASDAGEEEEVGVAGSALGEAACATDTISSPNGGSTTHSFEGVETITSPGTTYTNTGCSNEFIGQFTIPSGQGLDTVSVDDRGGVTPICSNMLDPTRHSDRGIALYKHTSSGWSSAQTSTEHGAISGTQCVWTLDSGQTTLADFNIGGSTGIDKVRVVTYVHHHSLLGDGYNITGPTLASRNAIQ